MIGFMNVNKAIITFRENRSADGNLNYQIKLYGVSNRSNMEISCNDSTRDFVEYSLKI